MHTGEAACSEYTLRGSAKIQPVSDSAGEAQPSRDPSGHSRMSDPVPLARAGFLSLGTGEGAILLLLLFLITNFKSRFHQCPAI